MIAPILDAPDARDVHSYANPAEARVTHVALDLAADFDEHRLSGTATLHIQAVKDAKQIILDTKGLEILAVRTARASPCPIRSANPIRSSAARWSSSSTARGASSLPIAARSTPPRCNG